MTLVDERVRVIPKQFHWRVRVGVMILRVKGEEVVRKRWEWVWPFFCRPVATKGGRTLELNLEATIAFIQREFCLFVFLLGKQ